MLPRGLFSKRRNIGRSCCTSVPPPKSTTKTFLSFPCTVLERGEPKLNGVLRHSALKSITGCWVLPTLPPKNSNRISTMSSPGTNCQNYSDSWYMLLLGLVPFSKKVDRSHNMLFFGTVLQNPAYESGCCPLVLRTKVSDGKDKCCPKITEKQLYVAAGTASPRRKICNVAYMETWTRIGPTSHVPYPSSHLRVLEKRIITFLCPVYFALHTSPKSPRN